MAVVTMLWCVAALLLIAVLALAMGRSNVATKVVYGTCLATSVIALVSAALGLLAGAGDQLLTLPLGIPWIGANFRIDVLAAFFLVVVNLGGAAASLYGLGYGRHEAAPHRVLPFFPVFLAAMNLVVLAADAFTFLLSWESMSLASLALVMAHHRDPENARAGYVYLLMASFGTMALLLAFGLLAGPPAAMASRRCASQSIAPRSPPWSSVWRFSAPAPRPAWCRFMSGSRSPIRRRRAMFRR